MAKIEGDAPNFDNLNIPDDEAVDAKPASEPEIVDIVAEPEVAEIVEINEAGPAAVESPAKEDAGAAPLANVEEEEQEEELEEKAPSKLPIYLPAAIAIGLPIVALVGAFIDISSFSGDPVGAISTAVYIIALGYIALAFWIGRKTNTLYVVLMGCALAAVLTAVFCLWMVLGRYKFDVKAQDAKQRVGMVWPGGSPGDVARPAPDCKSRAMCLV